MPVELDYDIIRPKRMVKRRADLVAFISVD